MYSFQKGFASILVVLLLLVAIPIGVYVVEHPTNIIPFAHGPSQYNSADTNTTRYILGGQITYQYATFFWPAKNVKVIIASVKTKQHFSTQTDANGNYYFEIQPGYYIIAPHDNLNTPFNPKYIPVTANQNITDLNFVGAHQ